jgi:hypothetical protein
VPGRHDLRRRHWLPHRPRRLQLIAARTFAQSLAGMLLLASACGPSIFTSDGGDLGPPDFGAPPEGGHVDMRVRDGGMAASGACGVDAGLCALRTSAPATCESRVDARGHEGDACRTASDCLDMLGCFAIAGGGGRCMRVCCPSADGICGPVAHCGGPAVLVSGDTSVWGRCVPPRSCDVLTGLSCDPGEGCYIVSDRADTDCRAAGAGAAGAACSQPNDCAPGFVCTGLGTSRCVRMCGLGDAGTPACSSHEGVCQAYPYSPPGTGVCTL